MINKKMVLSILVVAFIGIAAAGTWANYDVLAKDSGNTLKAGQIIVSLDRSQSLPFTVTSMIPDSTKDLIKYHVWGDGTDPYTITVKNTGDIPASLFISDALSATPSTSTLPSHVTLYYSTSSTGTPIAITNSPTDTTLNVANGGSQKLYFWYSYENIADSATQTAEMGQTVNAVLNFDLKNPDTSSNPGT